MNQSENIQKDSPDIALNWSSLYNPDSFFEMEA